ncbi:MAG: FHA domain-containing protein [Clostridiales bacterium]|nr:FHA domain-containing protein [Clostridiales bacterium]
MSTGSESFENSPWGQRYMIHLKNRDEICLHALSILQADLLSCYLPAYLSEDGSELVFDRSGCIPLSELSGKEKTYVYHHYRHLLTQFLTELIRSLDYSLSPKGICCLEEDLLYNRITQKLVCIYLPLTTKLKDGLARLSDIDEHALDELLHFPYEKKWISSPAMEKLHSFFRADDEASAIRYINTDFWECRRALPSRLRNLCGIWLFLFAMYLFCSGFIENRFEDTILSGITSALFFAGTFAMILLLLLHIQKYSKENKSTSEEKTRRRKTRNAQMLFPRQNEAVKSDPLDICSDPVQFIGGAGNKGKNAASRFTVWTNACTVGLDANCCEIYIDHPSLDLRHADMGRDEHGFFVRSLSTGKPTYVNRQRLRPNEKTYLKNGDLVGLGDLEYETVFIHH